MDASEKLSIVRTGKSIFVESAQGNFLYVESDGNRRSVLYNIPITKIDWCSLMDIPIGSITFKGITTTFGDFCEPDTIIRFN